jgi:hypothetical protein
MDGLGADDQGAHIQHAIERRNNVGNWAPAEEEKTRTIGIKPQGNFKATLISNRRKSLQIIGHAPRGKELKEVLKIIWINLKA